MSVLIKGMKMPKCCNECRFCGNGWCYAHPNPSNRDALKRREITNWCPLVEVPTPHGRLIDGDELKTAFPRMDNSTDIKIHSVRATINHMPTVIEAEE